jgi:hypothetical protein
VLLYNMSDDIYFLAIALRHKELSG